MVAGAFPLVKLGALLFRQISKPIANYAMNKAKTNTFFRTYVCMPPAQIYNWFEIKTKMWILNLGKPVNIPVLNEAMAIELGANLLGEAIVFSMAAAVLVSEYNRSRKSEEAKENARKQELKNLIRNLQELALRVEQQDAQLRDISRRVLSFKEYQEFEKQTTVQISKKLALLLEETSSEPSSETPSEPPSERPSEPPSEPPSKPPSPPSFEPPVPPATKASAPDNTPVKKTEEKPKMKNLILKTTDKILEDITGNDGTYKDSGLLIDALRYLQYDVCRATIIVK